MRRTRPFDRRICLEASKHAGSKQHAPTKPGAPKVHAHTEPDRPGHQLPSRAFGDEPEAAALPRQHRQRHGGGPGRIYTRHHRRLFHQFDQRHRGLHHHLLWVADGPDRHCFRVVFQQGLLQLQKAVAAAGHHRHLRADRGRARVGAHLDTVRLSVRLRHFRAAGAAHPCQYRFERVLVPVLRGYADRSG